MNTLVKFASALALIAALTASACGGSPSGPSGSAGLNLRLTDSPYADAMAVLVTISGVKVQHEEDGWVDLALPGGAASVTCDLKRLNGPDELLGFDPTLPDGHYTQIRMVVDSATLYFENVSGGATACEATEPDGQNAKLEIPSGEVKINHGFDLTSGETTTIVVDFVGDESIMTHETGNGRFIMRPVVRVKRTSTE